MSSCARRNAWLPALALCFLIATQAPATTNIPNGTRIEAAPVDGAFTAHRQAAAADVRAKSASGLRSPIDLSHLQHKNVFALASPRAFPASYDLRALGQVTPVRDQDPYSTCWAFGAMASLESSLLKNGTGEWDLSEWHLAYFQVHDRTSVDVSFTPTDVEEDEDATFDQGGEDAVAVALLARGTGAVLERDCPYRDETPLSDGSLPTGREPMRVLLRQALYLPPQDEREESQPACAANIKYALMHYGAVTVGMFGETDDPHYNNAETHAYHYAGDDETDHVVTIVGWDDTYPRGNFSAENRPGRDGAWIAKNSAGPEFGDGGYFYISYESRLEDGVAYVGEPVDPTGIRGTPYSLVYDYDPLGWCSTYGYPGSDTAWFSNVFTARGDERIGVVSFYTPTENARFEISLYTDVAGDPSTGTSAFGPQAGTLDAPGYRSVTLDAPVAVRKGQKFAVIVKLTTPGYDHPIALELPIEEYSEKATAHAGESYVSENGGTWKDLTFLEKDANVCLKAFGAPESAPHWE